MFCWSEGRLLDSRTWVIPCGSGSPHRLLGRWELAGVPQNLVLSLNRQAVCAPSTDCGPSHPQSVCCGGNMCLDPLWAPVHPLPLTPKGRSECERLLRSRTHTCRRAPALLPGRSPLLLNGHQCQFMRPPDRHSSVAVGIAPQVCGGCCHPHRCRSRM